MLFLSQLRWGERRREIRSISAGPSWPGIILVSVLLLGWSVGVVSAQHPLSSPEPRRGDLGADFQDSVFLNHSPGKTLISKLEQTEANLVTRAAAGLTNLRNGSSSIADVDGENGLDLLITGRDVSGTPTATLYLRNGDGTFSEAEAGLAGVTHSSVSIGDVDRDGNSDVLITGRDENSIPTARLYLGNGDGSFTEVDDQSLTGVESGATLIDTLNADDIPDLVITGRDETGEPSARVYLGNDDGTFTMTTSLTGVRESSASVSDLDGDGHHDLVITGLDESGVPSARLYRGQGDGTFSEAGAGLMGVTQGASSIADVDGDGNQDLLITGRDEGGSPSATLYLGDGAGGLSDVAGTGLTGVELGSSSIADVDGDGNQDLLITGRNASGNPTATLYRGQGDGTFSEAGAGLTGVENASSSIRDVDGDGDLDVLVSGTSWISSRFVQHAARLYINRGNQPATNRPPKFARSFNNERLVPGLTLTRRIEAGDLDGDPVSIELAGSPLNTSLTDAGNGVAELTFTPDQSQAGQTIDLRVEVSDDQGETDSFSASVTIPPGFAALPAGLIGVSSSSSSIADVNGDDNLDLLVTGREASRNPTATLYLGNGDGSFDEAGAGLTGVSRGTSSIADLDEDGNPDVLITGSETATLYLGAGDGTFEQVDAGLTGVARSSSSIADVNGDGNQDLLITGSGTATLYLGNGDGSFDEAGAGLTGVSRGASSIADVNGDGHPDLLITGEDAGGDPTATLYLRNEDGSFDKEGGELNGVTASSSSIGDVDKNGTPDLLITGRDVSGSTTATIYLGEGDGTFTNAEADLNGVDAGASSIVDADGDGNPDLLVTGSLSSNLYLGGGDGTFSPVDMGLAGVSGSSTSIGDIDGDGDPDMLVTGISGVSLSPTTVLYENLGRGGPALLADVNSIEFSRTLVGTTGPDTTAIEFSNVGGATAAGLSVEIDDDFVITRDSGEDVLEPGSARVVEVAFQPDVPEADRTGTLTLSSDDGAEASVELSGDGIGVSVQTEEVPRGQSVEMRLRPEGPFRPTNGTLYLWRGGQSFARHLEISLREGEGQEFVATVPDSLVTARGINYFAELSEGGAFSVVAPSGSFRDERGWPGHLPVSFESLPLPEGFEVEAGAYRMVSIPAHVEGGVRRAFEQSYGTYDPETWRLLQWSAREGYRAFSEIDSVGPGQSLWLITSEGDPFSIEDGQTVDGHPPHEIELAPGWNQIGGPYGFAVPWPVIEEATDAAPEGLGSPVAYRDSAYRYLDPETAVLEPWEGYFVYNATAAPVQLVVPPVGTEELESGAAKAFAEGSSLERSQADSRSATDFCLRADRCVQATRVPSLGSEPDVKGASAEEGTYTLQVEVQPSGDRSGSAGRRGRTGQRVWLGLRPGAEAGRDTTDFAQAPPIEQGLRVSLIERQGALGSSPQDASPEESSQKEEAGKASRRAAGKSSGNAAGEVERQGARYAGSFKPGEGKGEQWELLVENRSSGTFRQSATAQLRLAEWGALPEGFGRYVFDVERGRRLAAEGASLSLDAGERRRIKVIVGTESYARAESEGLSLKRYEEALRGNAPNPFSRRTRIEYVLEEREEVVLEVYNVLGQRVRRLIQGEEQEAGPHAIQWDGRNDLGRPVGSGMYFYRLEAGDFTDTRKMVLVR